MRTISDKLWRNVRDGVRTLRRSPGFTALAIVVLAVSIGANTAIFSIVNAVLLRPLPVDAPAELAFVYSPFPDTPVVTVDEVMSYRTDTSNLTAVGWTSPGSATIGSGDPLAGEDVSANSFQLLGVRPRLGPGRD